MLVALCVAASWIFVYGLGYIIVIHAPRAMLGEPTAGWTKTYVTRVSPREDVSLDDGERVKFALVKVADPPRGMERPVRLARVPARKRFRAWVSVQGDEPSVALTPPDHYLGLRLVMVLTMSAGLAFVSFRCASTVGSALTQELRRRSRPTSPPLP